MRNIEYHKARDFYRQLACHMINILGFRKIHDNVNRKIYSANINNIYYKFYYYPNDTSQTVMLEIDNILIADSSVIKELAKLLGYE
jgi:catechol 2,3-dioxygenase-like lactoylglutathione lyase family enzyme